MRLPNDQRASTHNELCPLSRSDSLPRNSFSTAHPAPSSRKTTSSSRPWTSVHTQKQLWGFSSRQDRHLLLPKAPAPSLSVSSALLPQFASRSSSAHPLLPTVPFADTARDSLCHAFSLTKPTQYSRLAVLQKEKTDLIEALASHKIALSYSRTALKEETVACSATVSALGAVEKQNRHVEPRSTSLKLKHDLRQKVFPLFTTLLTKSSTDFPQPFQPVSLD